MTSLTTFLLFSLPAPLHRPSFPTIQLERILFWVYYLPKCLILHVKLVKPMTNCTKKLHYAHITSSMFYPVLDETPFQ